jgi:hypothetical protein
LLADGALEPDEITQCLMTQQGIKQEAKNNPYFLISFEFIRNGRFSLLEFGAFPALLNSQMDVG